MDRLRGIGGCPWDAEQTHRSLVGYLVEEAYETIEAIETDDDAALREELGDLLLQVVFHARIAAEQPTGFDIDDVAGDIVAKLIRRHPHVFADGSADSAAHVEAQWHARKAAEKGRTSVTDGVPLGMPSLLLTRKLMHRAGNGAAAAADVDVAGSAATEAAARALAAVGDDQAALGELLIALVAVADAAGLDAEGAARSAARDYRSRLLAAESAVAESAG
ncbi:MAG TPA: MazG family protein [Actinomycetota bacterium]|jgi:XTP/dITP diphosphohydrolase|nr:MazG family protein [Actinomycetota bacterium]